MTPEIVIGEKVQKILSSNHCNGYIILDVSCYKDFSSSKRLCCWAGFIPGSNETSGKKKSVRITRAGNYLKPALAQCTHAAVKSEKYPYYKKK